MKLEKPQSSVNVIFFTQITDSPSCASRSSWLESAPRGTNAIKTLKLCRNNMTMTSSLSLCNVSYLLLPKFPMIAILFNTNLQNNRQCNLLSSERDVDAIKFFQQMPVSSPVWMEGTVCQGADGSGYRCSRRSCLICTMQGDVVKTTMLIGYRSRSPFSAERVYSSTQQKCLVTCCVVFFYDRTLRLHVSQFDSTSTNFSGYRVCCMSPKKMLGGIYA